MSVEGYDRATHVEVIQYPGINLPRELVEKLLEQLDIDEHRARIGELVGDDGEERFGTKSLLGGALSAPSRIERLVTEFEEL